MSGLFWYGSPPGSYSSAVRYVCVCHICGNHFLARSNAHDATSSRAANRHLPGSGMLSAVSWLGRLQARGSASSFTVGFGSDLRGLPHHNGTESGKAFMGAGGMSCFTRLLAETSSCPSTTLFYKSQRPIWIVNHSHRLVHTPFALAMRLRLIHLRPPSGVPTTAFHI